MQLLRKYSNRLENPTDNFKVVSSSLSFKVDPQKALQIVYVRFLNNKASIAPIKDTRLWIQKQIVESSTERIRCEARNRGTCLTKQSPILPICMYGVLPRETVLNIDALFMPMLFEVALPDHLKKIHLEHTLKETENKLKTSLTRVSNLAKISTFFLNVYIYNLTTFCSSR